MPANFSLRIKNAQRLLGAAETGVFDLATAHAVAMRIPISVSSNNLLAATKKIQEAFGLTADGVVGPMTMTRIESMLSPKLPAIPAGASMIVSRRSIDMLISFEVGSKDLYTQKYQQPTWPGGASGVTIGIGYDLGYYTSAQISNAWKAQTSQADLQTLLTVAGKKGDVCKGLIPSVKGIKIPYDKAYSVFYQSTLPSFAGQTRKAYPGVEKLPPDAQGALLSLVYNRGAAIDATDRRKEMKAIVELVKNGNVKAIGAQIRSMKRLWDPKKQKGLIVRREQEAVLAEAATFDFLPEQLVMV